ncbi:VOC family protein [Nocardiopsis suaedae]|uniref:VOC family protein n=1 Tax=Nocardiopsis suaedae TaxID=3018444 RepID=A0ABT4TPX5_9ACTN|nr:VOC family protein [Nocardiopsis suaedae]MDA2806745.1 VOC family protein [Nocardiopsis suaedae]
MSDEATTTPAPGPGVWPGLGYRDAEAALKFLTGVLGFTEALTVRGRGGIGHCEVRWPEGGGLMFGSLGSEEDARPAQLYVVTADPDRVHARAVEHGAHIIQEPYGTDYGSRNVTVADPEGNVFTFGTYPGAEPGGAQGAGGP